MTGRVPHPTVETRTEGPFLRGSQSAFVGVTTPAIFVPGELDGGESGCSLSFFEDRASGGESGFQRRTS